MNSFAHTLFNFGLSTVYIATVNELLNIGVRMYVTLLQRGQEGKLIFPIKRVTLAASGTESGNQTKRGTEADRTWMLEGLCPNWLLEAA